MRTVSVSLCAYLIRTDGGGPCKAKVYGSDLCRPLRDIGDLSRQGKTALIEYD